MTRWQMLPAALLLATAAPIAAQTTPPPAISATAPIKLTPADEKRLFEAGQRYTRWFLAGRADSLLEAMDPEMASHAGDVGGIEGIREMMRQVAERAGVETEMTEEKLTRRNGYPQFWHAAKFRDFPDDEIVMRWVMDADGKVRGVGFGPKSRSPEPDPS